MAECLQISQNGRGDSNSDTDDDDYEEFCETFTFSVSFDEFNSNNKNNHCINAYLLCLHFRQHRPVVFAMDIMRLVLVNHSVARVMHFYFQ